MAQLSLLVLRVADLSAAVAFYRALGLTLEREQHGSGPVHYSIRLGSLVLELYPRPPRGPVTQGLRLGLEVGDLSGILERLSQLGCPFDRVGGASDSVWTEDPEGHRLLLSQSGPIHATLSSK